MLDPLALWVTPVSDTGGVARYVLDVARAGIPGFRLAVLCPPGRLADELGAAGAAVLTGPLGPDAAPGCSGAATRTPGAAPHGTDGVSHGVDGASHRADGDDAAHRAVGTVRAAAASAATLRHAVRTLRPAVVHSHLAYADLVCAAVLRGLRVPGVPGHARVGGVPLLVSTEHGIADDPGLYHASPRRARAMAALHTRRLRRTDAAIAVSQATAAVMRRRWDARGVVVVPNGIDRPEPTAAPRRAPDAPRVLSLSRLAPEKNLDALLDSLALLRTTHPGARLTLAGEGEERHRLLARVERLGLTDGVTLPGHVDPCTAMAEHDVVVQLSRWENCSYTLLDAAACGLGVVATDVGGNAEILPARCLVPPGDPDVPAAVARLIERQVDPRERPGPPAGWPTPQDTTRAVSALYTMLLNRTGTPA